MKRPLPGVLRFQFGNSGGYLRLVVLLSILFVGVPGCSPGSAQTSPQPLMWRAVSPSTSNALPQIQLLSHDSLGMSGVAGSLAERAQRVVIRNQAVFDGLWTSAFEHDFDPVAPPRVDFSKSIVVGIAGGSIKDEGRVVVDTVGSNDRGLIVVISTEQGCAPIEIVVHPLLFIAIPSVAKRVEFVERTRPAPNCGR